MGKVGRRGSTRLVHTADEIVHYDIHVEGFCKVLAALELCRRALANVGVLDGGGSLAGARRA
jgi:hypothetical protein